MGRQAHFGRVTTLFAGSPQPSFPLYVMQL